MEYVAAKTKDAQEMMLWRCTVMFFGVANCEGPPNLCPDCLRATCVRTAIQSCARWCAHVGAAFGAWRSACSSSRSMHMSLPLLPGTGSTCCVSFFLGIEGPIMATGLRSCDWEAVLFCSPLLLRLLCEISAPDSAGQDGIHCTFSALVCNC